MVLVNVCILEFPWVESFGDAIIKARERERERERENEELLIGWPRCRWSFAEIRISSPWISDSLPRKVKFQFTKVMRWEEKGEGRVSHISSKTYPGVRGECGEESGFWITTYQCPPTFAKKHFSGEGEGLCYYTIDSQSLRWEDETPE